MHGIFAEYPKKRAAFMLIDNKKAFLIIGIAVGLSIALGAVVRSLLEESGQVPFATLSQIEGYASTLPEFPPSDDQDWNDPRFDKFNASRDLNIWQKIRLRFNLFKAPVWSPQYLAEQVKERALFHEQIGLENGERSFIHIKADNDTRIFIIGDAHGAFHSLLRDLAYLKQSTIINENLKLKENFYIIFNGNAIDKSAYSIDTLILITTLMKKNPWQVFYVAGEHERDSNWRDYGLRRELMARGYPYSTQAIPFRKEIDSFFKTLPEAVYISARNESFDVIRIAFNNHLALSYDEKKISPAFLEQKDKVKAYQFTTATTIIHPIDVRATIRSEGMETKRVKNGIGLLDQDYGASAWASLSSPINPHKIYRDIHEDSFLEIIMKDSIDNALILSHYQDPRLSGGFKKSEARSLVFSGINEQRLPSIKVGSTMSLIRGVPTMGKQVELGINLAVNQFNLDQHDAKMHVRLYIENDDYVPQAARLNVVKQREEGIKLFLLPTGTPTIMSYLDLIKKQEMAVFFPISGAMELRQKSLLNMIHLRPSYEDEVKALIESLVKEYGALKFAFFYQDDSYGRGPFLQALKELNKHGISEYTAIPYARGAVSFQHQVKLFKQSQAEALALFSTATATEEFIRQLGIESLSTTQIFGISFVGELSLRRFAKRLGLNLMLASPVPNPKNFNEPIGINYRKIMDAEKKEYDVFSFESYIASTLLFHVLNQVSPTIINPRSIVEKIEHISDNFMGFPIRFNPGSRSLARYVWIEKTDKLEWSKYSIY